MSVNRGKQFEKVVQECFERIDDVSIDRIHDQTTGYKGSTNICDFIVFRQPNEFYFECKTIHGNTLSIYSNPKEDKRGHVYGFYGDITDKQWEGLAEKSQIEGVYAGILCWWVDKNVTRFIPIQNLQHIRDFCGAKSIKYDGTFPVVYDKHREYDRYENIELIAERKRVFYDYDMEALLNEITERYP